MFVVDDDNVGWDRDWEIVRVWNVFGYCFDICLVGFIVEMVYEDD